MEEFLRAEQHLQMIPNGKKQKIFVEENRISDFRVCAIYGTYPKKYFRDGKSGTALNH